MKAITPILFLLLLATAGDAQNANGVWKGYLHQSRMAEDLPGFAHAWRLGGSKRLPVNELHEVEYFFSKNADSLSGTYFIRASFDTAMTGFFLLSAHFKDKTLSYVADDKSWEKTNDFWTFCYNKGRLRYYVRDGYEYLEGAWQGWTASTTCTPAIVGIWRPYKQTESKPETRAERKVDIRENYQIRDSTVVIDIWDEQYEDGDTITLRLNGKILLKNHRVTKDKRRIRFKLADEYNVLEMVAVNTGKTPPNTAAFRIWEGAQYQEIILKSDFGKTEAIILRRGQ